MVACLARAGGRAAPLEFQPGKQLAAATAPNGDNVFILTLPSPDLAGKAKRTVHEAISESGQTGLMVSRTADGGLVFIAVLGVGGVNGGIPSAATEKLAHECATRPNLGSVQT
jgi:hypothetical protein